MPDAASYRVTSSDGTQIAVWRSGSGPPLVLVHGTTADHTRWTRIARELESRFTVHAMDRRGRGGSGDAEAYSIESEGDDIVAVAAHAGGSVNLLGHSYGGLCCLEAALQIPALRRLVLYEPPLANGVDIVPPYVLARLDDLIGRGNREEAVLVFFREVVHMPEDQLSVMRSHPTWAGRVAAAHTLTRETRSEARSRVDGERLRGLEVSTLLLLGGESPAMFREAILKLAATFPRSRIHEMPGQQHVAMDMIPSEFAHLVSSFLLADDLDAA